METVKDPHANDPLRKAFGSKLKVGDKYTYVGEYAGLLHKGDVVTVDVSPFTNMLAFKMLGSYLSSVYDPSEWVERRLCGLHADALVTDDIFDNDPVNNPTHYTSHPSGIECIDVTRHMSFNLGNAVKYIWRCDLKKDAIEDLEKAVFYLNDEIEKRKSNDV